MSPQDEPVSPACPTHHVPVCPTHWSGMVCVISGTWQSGGRSRVTLAGRLQKAQPVLGVPLLWPPLAEPAACLGRRVAEAEAELQPLETAARGGAGAGAGPSQIPDPSELQAPRAPCRGELFAALGNQHTCKHARSGSGRLPGPAGQLSEVLPPAPQPRASTLSRDQHRGVPAPLLRAGIPPGPNRPRGAGMRGRWLPDPLRDQPPTPPLTKTETEVPGRVRDTGGREGFGC